MPSRSPEQPREASHADIIKAVQNEVGALTRHIDIRFAQIETRADERQEAADHRFARVEAMVANIGREQSKLEGEAIGRRAAAASVAMGEAPEHDGGFVFKHGWRSWLVVFVAAVTGLGALKAALLAMDALGAAIAAGWRVMIHPPH